MSIRSRSLWSKSQIQHLLLIIVAIFSISACTINNQENEENYEIRDIRPKWSPQGDLIAFSSIRSGNDDIWVVNTTQSIINLTRDSQFLDYAASWFPYHNAIAFVSNRHGNNDIWYMNIDTTTLNNLTEDYDGDDLSPIVSPSGEFIAFLSDRNNTIDLWLMRENGSNPQNLTHTTDYFAYPAVTWSRDSKKLTFSTSNILWIIEIDEDGRLINTNKFALEINFTHLAISPDGKSVALQVRRANTKWTIMIFDLMSEQLTDLFSAEETAIFPAWSPDGSKIAYNGGNGSIWYIELNTLVKTNLNRSTVKGTSPVWSPDGNKIAFESRQNLSSIWTVDINSFELVDLTGEE